MDSNVIFCRRLLAGIMPEVKGYLTKDTIGRVWVYHFGKGDTWEFHVNKCEQYPNGFYECLNADNAYHAKYKGFCLLLRMAGVKGYTREE